MINDFILAKYAGYDYAGTIRDQAHTLRLFKGSKTPGFELYLNWMSTLQNHVEFIPFVLWWARLSYVLHGLCCTRSNIEIFDHTFALYIWCSASEPMRRGNFFTSVKYAGLRLRPLFISQPVTRPLFLREQQHTFLGTVLQTVILFFCWFLPANLRPRVYLVD